jgi:hypothetical protein
MSNSKTSDAVCSTNVMTLGSAPSMAMANLYQTLAFNTSLAAANAVVAHQQANMAHQAATTEGVHLLYSLIKR